MGLLFTYGLTYGGAVASLFNPYMGLLVYVCFAIVKPDYMWYWSVPRGNYSRVGDVGFAGIDNTAVAVALVTCAGLAFVLGRDTPHWWLKGLALAAAAFMAHAIWFSLSRGGMLAVFITGIISFLLLPKRPRH